MHITSLFVLFVLTVSFVAAAPINNVATGSEKRVWDIIYKELEKLGMKITPSTESYVWLEKPKL